MTVEQYTIDCEYLAYIKQKKKFEKNYEKVIIIL